MDRVDEWRLFTEVAGKRSFRGAARSYRVSPQAVTRAIAALEERLGRRLLNRTTRSVSLTDAGTRYLERCRRVLAEIDQLDAGDPEAALTGTLTITAPVAFGQLHVVPVVAELLAAHPGIDVRLGLSDRIASLAEEGIDAAIRIGALPDSALRAVRLGTVRLVCCASPAYLARRGTPRDPFALVRHDCIALAGLTPIAERWAFPAAGGGGTVRSVKVRARLAVDAAPAAIEAALASVGIARVLSYQVDHLLAKGKLRAVLERFEPAPRPVHLVHLPGGPVRLAAAFAALATVRLRERLS